jgi:hypothetical protein
MFIPRKIEMYGHVVVSVRTRTLGHETAQNHGFFLPLQRITVSSIFL